MPASLVKAAQLLRQAVKVDGCATGLVSLLARAAHSSDVDAAGPAARAATAPCL